ncbi:MAG: DUF1987 domain-containing protein [Bacteroidales bacterium]|jgi:hypothetical protein
MKDIHLGTSNKTPYFPEVHFNAKTGECSLAGESYMEETYKFYIPLMEWLKEYIVEVQGPITLHIKLIYLNTSTSKCLLDIFEILKNYKDAEGKVVVKWSYLSDDPDMVEEVEDFEIESGLAIELIEVKE